MREAGYKCDQHHLQKACPLATINSPRAHNRGKEHIQSSATEIKQTNELDLFPAARLGESGAAGTVENL